MLSLNCRNEVSWRLIFCPASILVYVSLAICTICTHFVVSFHSKNFMVGSIVAVGVLSVKILTCFCLYILKLLDHCNCY